MGPPFEHHPSTPAHVSGSAGDLDRAGAAVRDVSLAAARASVGASSDVWGLLVDPLRVLGEPVARRGADLDEAAVFAGSVMRRWAGAIIVHDATVDGLNREWEQASGSGFGVAEPTMHPAQDAGAREAAWDRYDTALASARQAVAADLRRRYRSARDDLEGTGDDLAAMLGRGPNEADWTTLGASGAAPAAFTGDDPGVPGGPEFVVGPPTRPDITWDEDFEYDSADPTIGDWIARAEWLAKLRGGQLLRDDLDDATQMYRHYWDNDGTEIEFDYEEAYLEDENVRRSVDDEIARAQRGAEALIRGGRTSFSMTGDPAPNSAYPVTENWQKTIGGYQQWSSGDVRVDGDRVTMTVTVHAEDHYNFNRKQQDIATEAPDDANGRFTELGWAKPFDSHGSVTRTVSWTLGDAPGSSDVDDVGDGPARNPGREDREDERGSGDPDRPVVPDNDRDTGGPRGG